MKSIPYFITLVLLLAFSSAHAIPAADKLSFNSEDKAEIIVNNRILAKVNDKPISVVDLMKKMDMFFYREFPEYANSKAARYQFYNVNWKPVLQELINKEIILADAEDIKLEVSNGDIRQEMEQLFGPNIIANLDKVGLTMDEAWKIIKGDILLRRMMIYRVNSKAIRQIGPQEIRMAYEKYIKEHASSDEWHYHVVSIRDKDAQRGAVAAEKLHLIIKNDPNASFEEVAAKAKEIPVEKGTVMNVSDEFVHNELQISPSYKEVLAQLKPGTFSDPIGQKSRSDKTTVYRVFFLKEKVDAKNVAFNDVENELKDQLLQEAVAKETDAYLKKLRQHFALSENVVKDLPENFQPFSLR